MDPAVHRQAASGADEDSGALLASRKRCNSFCAPTIIVNHQVGEVGVHRCGYTSPTGRSIDDA